MELLFKFPPLVKTFSIPYNQPTLLGNKAVFLGVLINTEKCLKQIIDFLAKLVISSNPSSFSDKEFDILQSIQRKLVLLEDEEECEVENPREEQSSSSSNIKDSQRLTQEERSLLMLSIEFVISGEIINEEKEQKPISELNIIKNSTIIIVRFNFRKGFDSKSQTTTPFHQKTQEIAEFFKCKEHKNQICTHFCKTCQKLICAFDFVPNSKQKPEENCKKHDVITLEEHQIEQNDEISQQKQELEKKNQEIVQINEILEADSKEFTIKKEKNLESFKTICKNLKEIDEVMSINNENMSEVDYIKLELMMKLSPKSKDLIHGIKIEGNDKLEDLTKEAEIRKKKVFELFEENSVLKTSDEKLNERIKSLEKENRDFVEKFVHSMQKLPAKLQEGINGNDKVAKRINVAIISDCEDKISAYVQKHLEKNNSLIKVTNSTKFSGEKSKNEIPKRNWDQEHVFLIFSIFTPFPSWLGDFLFGQYKLGKGIVLGGDYIFSENADGFCGSIGKEVPCSKGELLNNDGPKNLIKFEKDHPILENVDKFDGGKASHRVKIKFLQPASSDEVRLIGTWDDEEKTPMIITKRNLKQNFGNIVVLNFYPVSGEICDGDRIMQNSLIWASKPYHQILISKLISENYSEIYEFLKHITPQPPSDIKMQI